MMSKVKNSEKCPVPVSKVISPKPNSKKITGQSSSGLDENEIEEVSKKDVGKETGENNSTTISKEHQTIQSADNQQQANADSNRGQRADPVVNNEQKNDLGINSDQQVDSCSNTPHCATAENEAIRRSDRSAIKDLIKNFVLVKDEGRNYKEGEGGKGFGPQGRIIEENIIVMTKHINDVPSYKGVKWRYVAAMNCERGRMPVENVFKKFDQLISKKEEDRLAFVLGINEKVTMEHPLNYRPTWEELLTEADEKLLKDKKIPILLIYYQWTTFREAFREVEDETTLHAYQVREQMFEAAKLQPQILDKWNEEDKKANHQFPFGPAREFLLNNDATKNFILSLDEGNIPVYIHVQDSDVVSFQETLMFTNFQNEDVAPLIPDSVKCLLDKFDIVIDFHKERNRFLPIFVGGAHVYSPDEDLGKQGITSAKYITRFGTEMSNFVRHIVGQQQPYGIYFHEPNCLVLSPATASRLAEIETNTDMKMIYQRLAEGFKFGLDSEMQEFTRHVFKGVDDKLCRKGMVFCPSVVLASSMKRGNDKTFLADFDGEYDKTTKKFSNWSRKDPLKAVKSIPQEVIKSLYWIMMVQTSFEIHRFKGAAKFINEALKLFRSNFSLENQKAEVLELFEKLKEQYKLKNQGEEIAFRILTVAWETAQLIRLMLLDHAPNHDEGYSTNDGNEIRVFFAKRLNFVELGDNPFVLELLGLTSIEKKFSLTKDHVVKIASYAYEKNDQNKAKTAKALFNIATQTLDKVLIKNISPQTKKKFAENLDTEEKVRICLQKLNLDDKFDEIVKLHDTE